MHSKSSISRLIYLAFLSIAIVAPEVLSQTTDEMAGGDNAADEMPTEVTPLPTAINFEDTLVQDNDGNGQITIDAFGDSITRGTGDGIGVGESPDTVTTPSGEAGYPLRVEGFLNIPVSNLGIPGERLVDSGVFRFASEIPARRPDIVIIGDGTNDAIDLNSTTDYEISLQTMLNIAYASGSTPVLVTAPPTCCNASALNGLVQTFNAVIRERALVNGITLADVSKAYENTCVINSCFLLNIPEGIHPNIVGHDVSGEVITAALMQIDIFDPLGPSMLEEALFLVPGSVNTVPDALPPLPGDPNTTSETPSTT